MAPEYTYNANVSRVVDGDTIDLSVDLGFRTRLQIRTRLLGINAPEVSTPEGKAARDWLRAYLSIGDPVVVQTFKDPTDKYGRWLAEIWTNDASLSKTMLRMGLAVPYNP